MKSTVVLFTATLLLAGCVGTAKFPIIEPVSYRPSDIHPQNAVPVDTLSPTFSWKTTDSRQGYDFCIWQVGPDGAPGETYYYKEDIAGTEHVPEKLLEPNGEYFWSVRKHGSTVWATTSFTQFNPLYTSWGKGLPFHIKVQMKKA